MVLRRKPHLPPCWASAFKGELYPSSLTPDPPRGPLCGLWYKACSLQATTPCLAMSPYPCLSSSRRDKQEAKVLPRWGGSTHNSLLGF